MTNRNYRFTGVLAALLSLASYVHAGDTAKSEDRKSLIEMHEKMAERHRVAADCLKANRPIDECNREAMKGCPMMKSGTCPFMGDMGKMHEGMHHHMKGMKHEQGGSQHQDHRQQDTP